MPELVKAGKLYKALAPLYHLDDKKHEFVRDKREYVEIYQDKIIKNYKINPVIDKSKTPYKESEFEEFIYDTQEYSDELARLSNHFGVNKFLIERIAAYMIMSHSNKDLDELFSNNDFRVELNEMIQKKFPEISIKGKHAVRGVVSGRFQSVNINDRFMKKIQNLIPIYEKYGYALLVKENNGEWKQMSIGEFLDIANKYRPKIITRYKGLGEANSKQLWETTLNPDNRILIQMTMEDAQRDLKIFEKLHGQTKEALEARKDMMSNYRISRDDLDN